MARNCARSLKIPVRGTLGVVLLAKKEGRIPSAREILDELMGAGYHIRPNIMRQALHRLASNRPLSGL